MLHLHHLTMLNAAAAEAAPGVPVVGHLHGTELMMLEAIERDPGRWAHGPAWAERLRDWAARCERIVAAPGNVDRAVEQLGVAPERLVTLANGFDPVTFRPLDVDRRAVWRRVLVDEPRGWRPGEEPGSVRYDEAALDALCGGPVILYVGRFTEVKRLPLLLEAFADARERMRSPATLVLVGGHPGEWEGEHPAEAIDRLDLRDVLLAGWHDQSELPELLAASDLLVLPSARESFGQVIVEAMACGVPPISSDSHGPAHIIDDGETGWLFDVHDRAALVRRARRGRRRPGRAARAGRRAPSGRRSSASRGPRSPSSSSGSCAPPPAPRRGATATRAGRVRCPRRASRTRAARSGRPARRARRAPAGRRRAAASSARRRSRSARRRR